MKTSQIPSVQNNVLENKTELNNDFFDLKKIFSEEPDIVNRVEITHVDSLTRISNLTDTRTVNLHVGGKVIPFIMDTGADITVLNPDSVKFTEGVDCEIVGKITLEAA